MPAAGDYLAYGFTAAVDHTASSSGLYETIIGSWPPFPDISPDPLAAFTIMFDLHTPDTEFPNVFDLEPTLVFVVGGQDQACDPFSNAVTSTAHGHVEDFIGRGIAADRVQVNPAVVTGRFADGGSVRYVHNLSAGWRVEATIAVAFLYDLEPVPNQWLPLVFPVGTGSAQGSGGNPQLVLRSDTLSLDWMNMVYLGYNTGDATNAPTVDWGNWHSLIERADGPRRAGVGIWRPGDPFNTTLTPNTTPDFTEPYDSLLAGGLTVLNFGPASVNPPGRVMVVG